MGINSFSIRVPRSLFARKKHNAQRDEYADENDVAYFHNVSSLFNASSNGICFLV